MIPPDCNSHLGLLSASLFDYRSTRLTAVQICVAKYNNTLRHRPARLTKQQICFALPRSTRGQARKHTAVAGKVALISAPSFTDLCALSECFPARCVGRTVARHHLTHHQRLR